MTRHTPDMLPLTHHVETKDRFSRRAGGSAIILVIVSLVLMVLLGAAYLQQTRVQRFAVSAPGGDIDAVVASIIDQIKATLKDDLTDNQDDKFELYDYPWTNDSGDSANKWQVTKFDGSTAVAVGGQRDDTWLASTQPDFTNSRWRHVSDLNGIFLDYNKSSNSFNVTNGVPSEFVVDHSSPQQDDTNLPTGDNQLVDADGDGIPDSRWAYPPITQITGVTYTMAVRIVDLSALANVNVALSTVDTGGQHAPSPSEDAPRWTSPSELDLGQFVYRTLQQPGASGSMNNLRNIFNYRAGLNTVAIGYSNRNLFWQKQGRFLTGQLPYQRYGLGDEFELRYRNGLNKDPNNGGDTTTIETTADGMPAFLRASRNETTWSDVYSTEQNYFKNEPRHQLTTMNGAAIFRWPRAGQQFTPANGGNSDYKVDLNKADPAKLTGVIQNVYASGSAVTGFVSPQQFADQFAADIRDYADDDNHLTQVNQAWGMEALPFVTEVYAQRQYSGKKSGSPPNVDVIWTADGEAGWAIELRNPFRKPIKLKDVQVVLKTAGGQTILGDLNTLVTSASQLDPRQCLILYHQGDGASMTDLWKGVSPTPLTAKVSKTWPTDKQGDKPGDVTVELRAFDDSGKVLNWPYDKVTATTMPDSYKESGFTTPPTPPLKGYRQDDRLGNGNRVNALAIPDANFHAVIHEPAKTPSRDDTTDALGEADKTGANGPANVVDPNENQILISDAGQINQVGELAHLAILGPHGPGGNPADRTIPLRLRDRLGASYTDLSKLFISFKPSTGNLIDNDKSANYAVPRADFLIDQFTTMSPREDGVDNNGDNKVDDNSENLIPGTVNLNTASRTMLERLLPIPNAGLRQTVAKRIVAYRDKNGGNPNYSTNGRPSDVRQNPGIAYTGELFGPKITGDLLTTEDPGDTVVVPEGSKKIKVDFLSNDPNNTPNQADGIKDDREEKEMVARWLSQVASPRSDYFAAYVVVHGYDGGFTGNDVIESRRLIAIFRRNADDGKIEVKVIAPAGGSYYRVR